MTELIEINAYPVKNVLSRLLLDKTTGKNIIFATDYYSRYGCVDTDQITVDTLLGFDSVDIQPRVRKAQEEQSERTRQKAEVFTPTWIVKQMCDHCDSVWQNGKYADDWQKYICLRILEITCGEAPFLVTRYDTTTGEALPIAERTGMLDRKLQAIQADDEETWLKWAYKAYESTYGYEFQGDNLLIARINLLMTFCDYLEERWQRKATDSELKKIANILAWNLWQMDGLKDTVPLGVPGEAFHQFSLFEEDEPETPEEDDCKIYDWRNKKSLLFRDMKEGMTNMKFDFVIGNPPYQENITEETNQAKPIYHLFVNVAKQICNQQVVMITPARWYSGGIGLDDFRNEMINGQHISRLVDFPNAKECFPNISIGGGVCYFALGKEKYPECKVTNIQNGKETTMTRALNEYAILVRYNNSVGIIKKATSKNVDTIQSLVSSVSPFGISTKTRGEQLKDSEHPIRLFSSKGASYLSESTISKGLNYLKTYKVMLSQTGAEHAGEPSKDGRFNVLSSTMRVLDPMDVCTHSYLVVGDFNNQQEPASLIKYLKTKLVRFLVLQTISSIHITKSNFAFVPLQDFTPNSDIDWSKSIPEIDQQLYAKYGLTQEEIDFIETHVKEMD